MASYDLVILGGGPGGRGAALEAARAGRAVALIDEGPALGGDGPWITLRALAALALAAEDAPTSQGLDEAALTEISRHAIRRRQGYIGDQTFALKQAGVTIYTARGEVVDHRRVRLDGGEIVEGGALILACGDAPRQGPDGALDLAGLMDHVVRRGPAQTPRHLLIAGGGPVGVSVAASLSALGGKITLVHSGPRLLPGAEPEIAEDVARMLTRRGVALHLDARLTEIEAVEAGVRGRIEGPQARSATASHLLWTGRAPSALSLPRDPAVADAAGRFGLEGVYAVGALAGRRGPGAAWAHGVSVARALIGGQAAEALSAHSLPGRPQIAGLGVTEAAARAQGRSVRVGIAPLSAQGAARLSGQAWGQVKIVADAEYGEILGVQAVGADLDPLMAAALPLTRLEATLTEWAAMTWPLNLAGALGAAARQALSGAPS